MAYVNRRGEFFVTVFFEQTVNFGSGILTYSSKRGKIIPTRKRSSVGQSVRFTSERSRVRAPSFPPARKAGQPNIGKASANLFSSPTMGCSVLTVSPPPSANVVQWQNTSFPSWICGFDSRHLLHMPFLRERLFSARLPFCRNFTIVTFAT